MKLQSRLSLIAALLLLPAFLGCSFVPETRQRDRIHNPFPQLKKVAILPFFNQSGEPTLDTQLVTQRYYAALQAVPGFEVMPIGVSRIQYTQYALQHGEPTTGADFQRLAQAIGAEAVVVGSVTDYDAYYPPRLAMTVNWYAANDGFHPIPSGYGLPWGTEYEKDIPRRIVDEAEFELARSQLATQTPLPSSQTQTPAQTPAAEMMPREGDPGSNLEPGSHLEPAPADGLTPAGYVGNEPAMVGGFHSQAVVETDAMVDTGMPSNITDNSMANGVLMGEIPIDGQFHGEPWPPEAAAQLPLDWPAATDLIPDPPLPHRPETIVNHEPILSHTRIYHGDDPYFTGRLEDHIETGDDARPGGWQGYLRRSDDFIRFCCHLHITEMLESRGGADQSDLILRWPLSRY